MLALYYDSKRPKEEGNFYLELIDYAFMSDIKFGDQKIKRWDYWCDLARLEANIDSINKQLLKIKKAEKIFYFLRLLFIAF